MLAEKNEHRLKSRAIDQLIRSSLLIVVATTFTATTVCVNAWEIKQASEIQSLEASETLIDNPITADDARLRALLVFEMANGSLQVMHRDFFDEENIHAIPSASMEDVFVEMEKSYGISMHWINAGADVVNTDHQPRSDFERAASNAIQKGSKFVQQVAESEYRFAGAITLRSQCLKCHLKDRKSNEDKFSGLVITIPMSRTSTNDR